jgi:hypothetical protein
VRTRLLRGLVLLLAAALPAGAQEELPPEPAHFHIERITVEGPKEAAANIVRAETLLREGESYTEDQLRQAIYRIHRLPFVLDARFALRKGSQRGAYELLIEVEPARWFFYDNWLSAYKFGQPLDLEPPTFRFDREDSSASIGGLVGARLFVGRSGLLFASLDSLAGIQAGFTQYNLLGRGILASAGLSFNACCVREVLPLGLDPTFSFWTFDSSRQTSLGLSVPLGGPQSIQVALSERHGSAGERGQVLVDSLVDFRPTDELFFLQDGKLVYRRAEAKWVFDTSDDPLLPTRGVSASAGIEASQFKGSELTTLRFTPGSGVILDVHQPPFSSKLVAAAVSGIRHWSVTPRQTVSATAHVSAGRSQVENLLVSDGVVPALNLDSYGASVGVRHGITLVRSRGLGNFTDLRVETGVELGAERISRRFAPNPLQRFLFSVGLIFRNQWGRVRIALSYLDVGKVFG